MCEGLLQFRSVSVCVLEGLRGEINRLGPLSCFHEVLLI